MTTTLESMMGVEATNAELQALRIEVERLKVKLHDAEFVIMADDKTDAAYEGINTYRRSMFCGPCSMKEATTALGHLLGCVTCMRRR